MTTYELYRSFLTSLTQTHSIDEASAITAIIFKYFAGTDRASLIKHPTQFLNEKTISAIEESLDALKNNKPVQYITGEAWFYNMKLAVSPAVLIPRPETEQLTGIVMKFLKGKINPRIIDIGTGSGCMAIAIKKNNPSATVTAIDISPQALDIAVKNATAQSADINFIEVDFLAMESWSRLGGNDVLVSNPPYIPSDESTEMNKNVTDYEPGLALFVDKDQPLLFYEKIAEFGKTQLAEKAMIFLETHENFAEEVCKLFDSEFYEAAIKRDWADKQRFVIATRCPTQ